MPPWLELLLMALLLPGILLVILWIRGMRKSISVLGGVVVFILAFPLFGVGACVDTVTGKGGGCYTPGVGCLGGHQVSRLLA